MAEKLQGGKGKRPAWEPKNTCWHSELEHLTNWQDHPSHLTVSKAHSVSSPPRMHLSQSIPPMPALAPQEPVLRSNRAQLKVMLELKLSPSSGKIKPNENPKQQCLMTFGEIRTWTDYNMMLWDYRYFLKPGFIEASFILRRYILQDLEVKSHSI